MTDDTRLLLRFTLGGLVLARGELIEVIRAAKRDAAAASAANPSELALTVRHILIGALLDAPAALTRLARSRPVRLAQRVGKRFGSPLATRVAAWQARGAAEEVVAVALARAAVAQLVDDAVDEVGASPSLEAIIDAQGLDLKQDALDRMRDSTAAADARVERLFHRGRGR